MMLIFGGEPEWETRLSKVVSPFWTFCQAWVGPNQHAPMYGIIDGETLSFFLQTEGLEGDQRPRKENAPAFGFQGIHLAAFDLSLSDSDDHFAAILTTLGVLFSEIKRGHLAESRAIRLQTLWQKTQSRYRLHTASMKAKLWQDTLTQVLNREGVVQHLGKAVRDSKNNASSMTLIVVDLDWFKRVNDAHGHAVGDVVLRHVALV
jgi:hypothetical protein